ncbi:MAG TPA: amino acid adenylation domain-containing protein, partial [Pyrinomonadaceae bacterium]|nr:amino acid adenylation domain-containing protein [Pyrinomonadaceae bacterium]
DLFERETIARLVENFSQLLTSIVTEPDGNVGLLELMPEAEQRQLLVEWNKTATSYPREQTVTELFEAQTAQTPAAVAVVAGDEQLSYGELNRRANQVAHYLKSLGVGPETVVGICMERSLDLIVGLLGILKAGAAYLPLDPAYPLERLSFMLADGQAPVLLTQQQLLEVLPSQETQVVCVDCEWEEIATYSDHNPHVEVTPENLIYVMYTSGSTGKPKGAMNTHAGVLNCLQWMQETYQLTDSDRFLFKTSLNFDPSVWEIFWPLMVGARIVIAPMGAEADSAALVATIKRQRATVAYFVPSFLALFIEDEAASEASSLRYVICGGESISTEMVKRFYRRLSRAELHHSYGPTETAIAASETVCLNDDDSQHHRIPIGRPIANTQLYILDSHLQPVPTGAVGELYIGGDGLGRGYHNRAELTATRFIPDPFSSEAGARLYKTGDLVRYRLNGELEFGGRVDHQVKVRGVRIELGEIEETLLQHEAVFDAIVLVREDLPGEKRLVAYVAHQPGHTTTLDELREFLRTKLPEYMLPSAFVWLPEMPLTSNGKVDLRALPAPERESGATYVPPRDYLELQLARVWEQVLNVRPISMRDSFFDLGGHSLSAVGLMTRISQVAGEKIPLATLFQRRTIEELANYMREKRLGPSSSTLVELQSGGTQQPFFCVHPVGGNVFSYVALAHSLGDDQPFYGMQSLGLQEGEPVLTQIEQMAGHYLDALRSVQASGPYILGGWSMGGVVAFEMAQRLQREGEVVSLLALFDAPAPSAFNGMRELSEAECMLHFAEDLGIEVDHLPLDTLQQLATDEQLAYVMQQAKLAGVVPSASALAEITRLFRVYQANVRALFNYVASRYDGSITLFIPSESDRTEQLKGWRALAKGGVELHEVAGTHYTMLREPHVNELAQLLKNSILPHTSGRCSWTQSVPSAIADGLLISMQNS